MQNGGLPTLQPFLIQTDSEMEFFLKCNFFGNPYPSPVSYLNDRCQQVLKTYIDQIKAEHNRSFINFLDGRFR